MNTKVNFKIAEILGWKDITEATGSNAEVYLRGTRDPEGSCVRTYYNIWDFHDSLEGCQVMERKLVDSNREDYYGNLLWICERDFKNTGNKRNRSPISAAAPQRTEAFLRTFNAWD
jgi:hypothetical protein